MQRLKTFWSKGCLSKLILLGAAALVLLCLCAGLGMLVGAPNQTSGPVTSVARKPATPTPVPTNTKPPATSASDADMDAARADFTNWITTTACAPGDASNPQPAWCGTITGASFLPPRLMLTTTLTRADTAQLRNMAQLLSAFAYSNDNKKYNLTHILIVSDADGSTLAERKSLTDKIEFPQ